VPELAGMLYDSVHGKLLALPDTTRVYPAHGAGSLCGRSISKDTWSTIGRERMMNPALQPVSREVFIADVTRDVPETPVYFLHSRDTNQAGPSLDAERPLPPRLTPAEAQARVHAGAVLIDTRSAEAFAECHPAGALHVGLDGQYASWVGTLVRPDQDLVLLADRDREEEAVMRLARVGYERVAGFLDGGCEAWSAAGLPSAVAKLVTLVNDGVPDGVRVLDVRRDGEWRDGHLAGAVHAPLHRLPEQVASLDRNTEWLLVCAGGYRSIIGASILERAGFTRLRAASDGTDAWRRAGRPMVAEPATA
jgi:rhodanese-related sulfurtransferase